MKVLAVACAVFVALFAAAPAVADVFGPISLVSETTSEQAIFAHDPAISGDGHYIAFDGSFGGVTGVWRAELLRNAAGNLYTAKVEQVAGGDAELPSISGDGRYVSFTTNEDLEQLTKHSSGLPDPEYENTHKPPNVYVRDMAIAPSEPGAFTVVSAVNGGTQPLTYEYTSAKRTFEEEHYGSVAAGRSALGQNSRGELEVAFVTTAVSDLTDPATPSEPKTPALQVAVRYLGTDTTRLVSGLYEPASRQTTETPVSGEEGSEHTGAVYPGGSTKPFGPLPAYGKYGEEPPTGASISADGSTVAWMGEDIGEQAPLLAGESRPPLYTEPLWRRFEPGSETPTERVTGGSDPLNPACLTSGETELPASPSTSDPCQGPFVTPEGTKPSGLLKGGAGEVFIPRLSADGYTVAFVSQEPLVSLGEDFGHAQDGQQSDLYVADMRAGLTRNQALLPLTELAGGGTAGTASIYDFGISPDGSQVAFTTRRTQFPLGSPAYVTAPQAEPGMNELFDADLADDTLTRVTRGYEGGPSEHSHLTKPVGQDPYEENGDGALSPSFSANGDILAFSSTASNLVWGDGNTPPVEKGGTLDGSDAFVVERMVFPATPTPNEASPALGPTLEPGWNMGVTAVSRPNGSVLLYVQAPGVGTLRAGARGTVLAAFIHAARAARHVRKPKARSIAKTVMTRTVATGAVNTAGAGLTTLTLTLAHRYDGLADERGGFSAMVTVTLTAPGHPTLRETIPVTFLRKSRKAAHRHKGRVGTTRRRSRR